MRVSFDFDSTLNTFGAEQYAKELIERGINVIVCTSRCDDETANKLYRNYSHYNDDLKETCNRLGITEVYFTNHADKADIIDDLNVVWHLDDDMIEISLIGEKCQTPGIDFFSDCDWKEKCEALLKT